MLGNNPKAFQKKINELRIERDKIALDLSIKIGERDQAMSDLELAKKSLTVVNTLITSKKIQLVDLDIQIHAKDKNMREVDSSHNERSQGIEKHIAELKKQESILEEMLAIVPVKIEEINALNEMIAASNQKIVKANEELEKINAEIVEKAASLDERKKNLDRQEEAINAKIYSNSQMVTKFERDRGTFEHYVKRLQRIYDEKGIKIDLLGQFEIKRDKI